MLKAASSGVLSAPVDAVTPLVCGVPSKILYVRHNDASAGTPPHAEKKPESHQPAALVLHNKHIREVENYPIVGQTLWILDEQSATKLLLSSLDVDATTKLNEQIGVEFSLPKK